MAVTKKIITREISEEEFLKFKKLEPFAQFRQDSKACFHKDTLICTSETESYPVSTIIPSDNEGFTPSSSLLFLTPNKEQKEADATYFSYTYEWIIFTLENGDNIQVTPDHMMVAWRNKERIHCKAKRITMNDRIENVDYTSLHDLTIGINRITKKSFLIPEPSYCMSVPPLHEVVIQGQSGMRYAIGQCNFSFLFGASYKRFSQNTLEVSWSEDRVREFVKARGLEDSVKEMREKHSDVAEIYAYYYASSDYIRTNFFKSYPGLQDRIKRNEELAKEHGYIRSFHGGIRRVPLLMWCTDPTDIDGRTSKPRVRKDEDYKEMAGLINITANTSIQNDEVCDMNMAIARWMSDPKNKDNPIFGMVHDSSDFYILREGFKDTLQDIKDTFELQDTSWQETINFAIEGAVVDFTKEGAYYKHGEVVIK